MISFLYLRPFVDKKNMKLFTDDFILKTEEYSKVVF